MAEFKKLLHRDDLPALCLTYYTSFDVGELSLSVLTYREIEFEETPVIPLIFMVYEREEMSAHEYFFARFAKTIPEFKTLQRMCIIADEEVVIANAIQKNCPEIPRLRCWRQALLNIKNTLQLLNIKEIQQYEKDFLRLLEQNSATNYKSLLAQMYLKKWADVNNFTFHSYLNNVTNFFWIFSEIFKIFWQEHRSWHGENGCLGFATVRNRARDCWSINWKIQLHHASVWCLEQKFCWPHGNVPYGSRRFFQRLHFSKSISRRKLSIHTERRFDDWFQWKDCWECTRTVASWRVY